jgi:hypothetical protein
MAMATPDTRLKLAAPATAEPLHLLRLALPSEHGGWAFLLEPVLLALIVVPSSAGFAVAIAAIAVFLLRHPLRLAVSDLRRQRRYPRTVICLRFAIAYAAIGIISISFAIHQAGASILVPFVLALPLAGFQFFKDIRNRGRTLAPELTGAAAAGSIAAAIAIGGGATLTVAAVLWTFSILRSVPAILHVRAVLGRNGRSTAIALQFVALLAAAAMWYAHLAPAMGVAAMALLLFRAVLPPKANELARRIGVREISYGAVATLLTAIGFRLM